MHHPLPYVRFSSAYFLALSLCMGGVQATPRVAGDAKHDDPVPRESEAPRENFLSSLKQAFKQDFEHEVVRGHFDVGAPPDVVRRYYCLVDVKTGRMEANGVAGQLISRPDGMTGIKGTAVSLYSCASSEQRGVLVTAGYVLNGIPIAPGARVVKKSEGVVSTNAPPATQILSGTPPLHIDVGGIELGMSVDQVRQVLQSKRSLVYRESLHALSQDAPRRRLEPRTVAQRFVEVVSAVDPVTNGDGESLEVMFTPVPGAERVMAIRHTFANSAAHALHEGELNRALVKKYGGYAATDDLPAAATWRVQNSGDVQVGDPCNRRALFGGLAELQAEQPSRANIALKTSMEEFRYQIDNCGMAMITADHTNVASMAPKAEQLVARYTVTAYSPSIALAGATAAAQLMQPGLPTRRDEPDQNADTEHMRESAPVL